MFCLVEKTDPAWAIVASRDLPALLVDHAHCEMKAASNAISLATRHPENLELVLLLTTLAEEELAHFKEVVLELQRRGIALVPPRSDVYADRLRKAADQGPKPIGFLADRLLVAALIEARSCERFKLLSEAPVPEGIRAFYTRLFHAEATHYTKLVELAVRLVGARERVQARLATLAEREGEVLRSLRADGLTPTMHG